VFHRNGVLTKKEFQQGFMAEDGIHKVVPACFYGEILK